MSAVVNIWKMENNDSIRLAINNIFSMKRMLPSIRMFSNVPNIANLKNLISIFYDNIL